MTIIKKNRESITLKMSTQGDLTTFFSIAYFIPPFPQPQQTAPNPKYIKLGDLACATIQTAIEKMILYLSLRPLRYA
jgi:hypothetical protein